MPSDVSFHALDDRVIRRAGKTAWVWRDGAWHESASAWAKVVGLDGADTEAITPQEAARRGADVNASP